MRLLGIDYGLRRTGIAIGETETALALPFEMFEGLPDGQLAEAIGKLVRTERADAVVVGVPLFADGRVSQQTKLTEQFIAALTRAVPPEVPIHRIGEHLTSHDSEGKLAGHLTRNKRRQRVDALAAARILQDWLDEHAPPREGGHSPE